MTKPIALALSLALAAATLSAFRPTPLDDERAAVERAVLDYVEGIYEVKPELIDRGVHADLTKFGFWRPQAGASYQGGAMNFEQLRELAGKWNEGGKRAGPDAVKEVVVLDVLDQTAAAKLTAKWGIDYMHLARFDGEWKIVHVMWQSHPEAATEQGG